MRIGGGLVFASVLLGITFAVLPITLVGVMLTAVAVACAGILYRCYAP